MERLRLALQGKKTYLVAALLVLSAILEWVSGGGGFVAMFEMVDKVLLALGLGTLRAGVTTEAIKNVG